MKPLGEKLLLGAHALQELCLNVLHCLGQGVLELFEIFLVEENLVLLVFLFTYALALCDRDVEVLFGLGCLHVEEVRAFPSPHPFGEQLVFVAVGFQGLSLMND